MRDVVVALIMFGWLPIALFKPYVGVLLWDWLSHMNPHKQAYGFARYFGFLNFVVVATLAGMLLDRGKKSLPAHPIVIAIALYFVWTCVTTIFAYDPAYSFNKFNHAFKVMLFAFVVMIVMQSPNRLKAYIWVLIVSMGYIAIKGGLFTLATGGLGRVQGAGGMMADNNQLAVAMAMTLPLSLYLYANPPHRLLKWPAAFLALTVILSVIGTQSRGGFAAMAAVFFMLALKTKRKFTLIAVMIPLVAGGIYFAPDSWKARIESSEKTTEDSSFRGRVVMWKFSSNLVADHPIEGGGYDVFYVQRARELFTPPGERARAPHSIYFEVLGEHGYVGLVLFLTMLFTGWYSGGTAAKQFRPYNETRWLADLCTACQLSLVGYAAGGLTVNIATFDYFYDLLIIIVLCKQIGDQLVAKGVTAYTKKNDDVEDATSEGSKKWSPAGPKWSPPRPAARTGSATSR
ncbi:MAG: putative O-glycosylation ligase, exosortase A system-associated [Alphaproteobacteria bacterium]|nr:putative O-glycosylation ligase, exosortase A system-associated [Alphaproteobacteria bacterium]